MLSLHNEFGINPVHTAAPAPSADGSPKCYMVIVTDDSQGSSEGTSRIIQPCCRAAPLWHLRPTSGILWQEACEGKKKGGREAHAVGGEERAYETEDSDATVFDRNKNLSTPFHTHPSYPAPMTLSQRFLLAVGGGGGGGGGVYLESYTREARFLRRRRRRRRRIFTFVHARGAIPNEIEPTGSCQFRNEGFNEPVSR